MSFQQLETFVAVVEEGSVRRAAVRTHIAQPALTRQIQALEEELGVRLFRRTSRGMRLLVPGERFLPRARRMLAERDAARDEVRAPVADPSGSKPGRERPSPPR
ncbi:MAG: LysR family transcriptional regulator [Myxococcota bacterium]